MSFLRRRTVPTTSTSTSATSRGLSADAAPLRFVLVPPLSTASSPTACLVARVALRQSEPVERFDGVATAPTSSTTPRTEDYRLGSEKASVEVYRVLDPGNREPFVSLSRIFLACHISPLEGLLRFKLVRPTDYDSTLAGIAPFRDIWVPLKLATSIAEELGVFDELSGLLDWDSRKAFTVEDKEEGGIVHNWRIASDRIDPARYSTSAMLSTSFPRVHLLPPGNQVRTLVPTSLPTRPPTGSLPSSFSALWSHIVGSSIEAYEEHQDVDHESISSSSNHSSSGLGARSSSTSPDLTPSFLFMSLFSLLSLTNELPLDTRRRAASSNGAGNTYELPDRFELSRGDLIGPHFDQLKARLGLLDAIARIIAREWRQELEKELEGRRAKGKEKEPGLMDETQDQEAERWKRMQERLEKVEDELRRGPSLVPSRILEEGGGVDTHEVGALREEVVRLSTKVRRLEQQVEDPTMNSISASASATPEVEPEDVDDPSDEAGMEQASMMLQEDVKSEKGNSLWPLVVLGAAVYAAYSLR